MVGTLVTTWVGSNLQKYRIVDMGGRLVLEREARDSLGEIIWLVQELDEDHRMMVIKTLLEKIAAMPSFSKLS